jgi:hypothetical protein
LEIHFEVAFMKLLKAIGKFFTQKFLRIPVWEWFLIVIVFFIAGFLIAKNGGGPQFSDELWYMDAGLNGVKDYQIMNYYFHIYLQKPFLELASRPVAGAKLYWAFLVTLTSIMIYLCARWLNKKNTIFHSFFAVVMFYSMSILPQWAGDTKVDFTSMLVVTIVVMIYILATQKMLNRKAALFLIGFWLFMCLKSKETTVFISVVVFGFGFDGENKFSWKLFFKSLLPVLIGVATGIVVFMILSAIIVKDALWGIRISDWVKYFKISVPVSQKVNSPLNWYVDGIATMILIPFLLYIISGFKQHKDDMPPAQKLLWLYPVLLIIFLIIAFLTNGYKTEGRFILPAIPLICILAIQIFDYEFQGSLKKNAFTLGYIILGFGLMLGLYTLFNHLKIYEHWIWMDYVYSFVAPVAFSILLGFFFLVKKITIKTISIPSVCLVLIFFPPAIRNLKSIIVEKPNAVRLSQMYYPFSAFSQDIKYSENMRMYISPTLPAHYQMLMRRIEEVRSMFDIYFHVYTKIENFIYPTKFDPDTQAYSFTEPVDSIKAMNYDQAIIAYEDWQLLQQKPASFEMVTAKYNFKIDKHSEVVFLSLK